MSLLTTNYFPNKPHDIIFINRFAEEVNEISYAATMELQIEKGLAAIGAVWETMKFEMTPYRERQLYR